jgi:hypothetical protein
MKANLIELQKYLKGVEYTAHKQNFLTKAKSNGAKKEILSILEGLRENEFANPAEVSKAVGELDKTCFCGRLDTRALFILSIDCQSSFPREEWSIQRRPLPLSIFPVDRILTSYISDEWLCEAPVIFWQRKKLR